MIYQVIGFNVFIIVIICINNVSCHSKINKYISGRSIFKKSFSNGDNNKNLPNANRHDDEEATNGDNKRPFFRSDTDAQYLLGSVKHFKILAGSETDTQKHVGSEEELNALAAIDEIKTLDESDTAQQELERSDQDEDNVKTKIHITGDKIFGEIEIPSDFEPGSSNQGGGSSNKDNCWMDLKADRYVQELDRLDAQYSGIREKYQTDIGDDFEKQLLSVLVLSDGTAERAKHQSGGDYSLIPAGLNLGGYCMMRMPDSILFFHRMKLRNSTNFRVNYLHVDLVNMALVSRLSLNDLHLLGAYERCNTDNDPSVLFYIPSYGEIQLLMKDVDYKLEGRLRMINNRLLVELVNSEILTKEIIMMYVNKKNITSAPMKLQRHNIAEFISRMRADLDTWLKDYFNDYLMYYGEFKSTRNTQQFIEYEKKKTLLANEYADHVVESIKRRLHEFGAANVKIPHFTIYSVNNMKVSLHNGVLRGLDSIYRKSVATTMKIRQVRKIDAVVAFSKLKIEYQYDVAVGTGLPPLRGNLIMSADELSAHMLTSQISNPEMVEINFQNLVQMSPESLTVEGPANRVISNFKQMLGHSIIAIMSNTLLNTVYMMKTLTRCEPFLHGYDKPKFYEVVSDLLVNDFSETDKQNPSTNDGDVKGLDNKSDDADDNVNEQEIEHGDKTSNDYSKKHIDVSEDASKSAEHGIAEADKGGFENADYFLAKNDSVELEVPMNGKVEKMKVKSYSEFKLVKDGKQ